MNQADAVKPQRRHDLDALRAFAMLLGIVLHVGSAFTATGALGRGTASGPWFGHTLGLIHGFRMQLFFVVSGFFTMMLLQRRGTWAVSKQRGLRIALPLLLAMITIIPAGTWATEWATKRQKAAQPAPAPTLAAAVQSRDANAIQTLLGDAAQLERPDPVRGVTPLVWAVVNNDLPTARLLLDRNARVARAIRGGNTALHLAAMLGRREMVELLLQRGAKPSVPNAAGQTVADVTNLSWDDTRFALYSIGSSAGDRTAVEAGRQQVRQLLASFVPAPATVPATQAAVKVVRPVTRPVAAAQPQTRPAQASTRPAAPKVLVAASQPARAVATAPAATRPAVAKPAAPVAPARQPPPPPDFFQRYTTYLSSPAFRIWVGDEPIQLFTTAAFRHLWFLWFLCWLTPGLFVAAWAGRALGLRVPRWLVISPLCLLWLIPITLLPQWFMRHPAYLFGPETSSGWLPMPHMLLYYAIFFGFGALYYACGDFAATGLADPKGSRWRDVTRWWWLLLPLAFAVAYPIGKSYVSSRAVTAVTVTVYGWLVIFGMMGLFHALLKKEYKFVRYLSDASYWLYLTHIAPIPLVQLLVRDSSMAAPWKFVVMCLAITVGLLIVYDVFVRYTFIGAMLNGRKQRAPLFRRSPTVVPEAQTSGAMRREG